MDDSVCEGTESHNYKAGKKFWRYIRSRRKDTVNISTLKVEGILFSNDKIKADIVNNQYSFVFTREDTSSMPTPGTNPFPDIESVNISQAGIVKLLEQLNPKKACGPGLISCRVLKEATLSLRTGQLPSDWLVNANITPVFKKGKLDDPSNYRPVALTSIVCKTMEHSLNKAILIHLEKYNILSDCQHGFRQGRSCETQLVTTL